MTFVYLNGVRPSVRNCTRHWCNTTNGPQSCLAHCGSSHQPSNPQTNGLLTAPSRIKHVHSGVLHVMILYAINHLFTYSKMTNSQLIHENVTLTVMERRQYTKTTLK